MGQIMTVISFALSTICQVICMWRFSSTVLILKIMR